MKDTRHVALDMADSGILYQAGDSIGVYPKNPPGLVERTLKAFHWEGSEEVKDRQGTIHHLREFLSSVSNLRGISRNFLKAVGERATAGQPLFSMLSDESGETLKAYCHERHVWDLLEEYPGVRFSPQEGVDFLMPLLPRLYSIASSQELFGPEVHFTIAHLRYTAKGYPRIGICTHYLCELAPLGERSVPIFLQSAKDFHLPPASDTPIIMIGPGTGVAPFRAFMQEREIKGARKNWLFFGEWTRAHEFFYEEEWHCWADKGILKLDLAFSRDQKEKIYVQHRMEESSRELFAWLQEGAVLYVCGDAHRMAKDVEESLLKIISKEGGLSHEGAAHYLKDLRKHKRYLRDVY